MHSIRKWFYRPKKEDSSKLAQFYWADEELTMIATELDSFDGRTDPDRCSILVSQLRVCQDKVLGICNEIMDEAIPSLRANRDFRVKFPDDVLHETLAGQLWFGAECLAAGSNIMNREQESENMRPLAKALTRSLDNVRCLLREQSLKSPQCYSDKVKESLRIFDRLFAEFELCYVSAMVPIKSAKEYHMQQEIVVLFSETLLRALKIGLVTQDMVDDYDPSLMFTIPRLAIVWGLLIYPEGPLNVDKDPLEMSELFRTFYPLLFKIRSLLWTLTRVELQLLEKMLCSLEEPKFIASFKQMEREELPIHDSEHYINIFYQTHSSCKQFIQDFYAYNFGVFLGDEENSNVSYGNNLLRQNMNLQDNELLERARNEEVVQPESSVLGLSEVLNSSDNSGSSSIESEVNNEVNLQDLQQCETPQNKFPSDFNTSGISANSYSNSCQLPECSGEICQVNEMDVQHNLMEVKDSQSVEGKGSEQTEKINFNSSSSVGEAHGKCDCQILKRKSHSTQEFLCLEHCLSISHEGCLCNTDDTSLSDILQPIVMASRRNRIELSPENYYTGYSSSPESSPRTFLPPLSHSLPIHSSTDALRNSLQRSSISSGHHRRKTSILHRTIRQNRHPRFEYNIETTQPLDSHAALACTCLRPNIYCSRNEEFLRSSAPLAIPRVQELREASIRGTQTSSSCSSCQSVSSASHSGWEESSSPETSSYNSECQDDEEIALALQAVEIASHNEARARFKSSDDLLHRLFVCISGVADQLQTNNASDLRNILKSVFDMNCSKPTISTEEMPVTEEGTISSLSTFVSVSAVENSVICTTPDAPEDLVEESVSSTEETQNVISVEVTTQTTHSESLRDDDERDHNSVDSAEEVIPDHSPTPSLDLSTDRQDGITITSDICAAEDPPPWIPDELSDHCMACEAPFTLLRRRHHCRNCGKIFCSKCSSNSIPLPHYGHLKPVRVCNQCFMYQITALVVQQQF